MEHELHSPKMQDHFFSLLSRAWSNMVQAFGTTTLSIVVWSFAVPVVIWIITVVVDWFQRRRRHEVSPLRSAFGSSLLSAVIVASVTMVAWIAAFSVFVVRTNYQDYINSLSASTNLKKEKEKIEQDRDHWKEKAAKSSQSMNRQGPPPKTPNTINKAVVNGISHLAESGVLIQQNFVNSNDTEALKTAHARWLLDAHKILTSTAGESYFVQFKNAHGSAMMGCPNNRSIEGCGYWRDIEGKRAVLMNFITELRQLW